MGSMEKNRGYEKSGLKMSIYPTKFDLFFETQKYSRWHKKGWHKLFKSWGWHKRGGIKILGRGIKQGGIKF